MPAPAPHVVLCLAGKERRQRVTALGATATLRLAKGCVVSLDAVRDAPMGALFQVDPTQRQLTRLPDCRPLYEEHDIGEEELNARDNSQLVGDETAQSLSTEEIVRLKGEEAGVDIVQKIVAGSTTFESKTPLAQAKYIRKKQQKHCPLLTVQPPTPALVCELQYEKGEAALGMRVDTLAQMMAYGNVHANARVLCVDTIGGLLTATALRRVGADGSGFVVHTFGRASERNSPSNLGTVGTMDLQALGTRKLRNVPFDLIPLVLEATWQAAADGGCAAATPADHPPDGSSGTTALQEETAASPAQTRHLADVCSLSAAKDLLADGVDSLLVASRLDPMAVAALLWPLVGLSGSFSIFCPVLPPLQQLYEALRAGDHAVQMVLCDNWLREYQVLPNRTHPLVNMSGTGGYLLSGIKVESSRPFASRDGVAVLHTVPSHNTLPPGVVEELPAAVDGGSGGGGCEEPPTKTRRVA